MITQDLELLAKSVEGKSIVIADTFSENGLAFSLAHVLRNYVNRIYCVGEKYLMTHSPRGFRAIECGKVILIRGDLCTERSRIYELIRRLNSAPDYEINVTEMRE